MSRKLLITGLAVGLATASAGALADHDRGGYRYPYDRPSYQSYPPRAPYASRAAYQRAEYDYARVVAVEPVRRRVRISEPVRECWEDVEYRPEGPFSSRHVGGTILGGLVGGAIGNQVGRGEGRRIATVAGAVAGGAIGHQVSRDRQGPGREAGRVVERCDVYYRDSWEERIDGYDVTYEYAGRRYSTRTPYDPGDRIRIRVDVSPVG